MKNITKLIKQYPIESFFGLTYAISWGFLLLAYFVYENSLFLAWVGMFGPAISGLFITFICDGKVGLETLLAGLLHWRAGWKNYLFVFAIPLILVTGTILIHDGFDEMFRGIDLLSKVLPILLGMTLLMLLPIAGEEIGWRGFALPRMLIRFGPVKASLLIGILWGIWHIPAALNPSSVLNRAPLLWSSIIFTISTTAFSFLYTWLWNSSGKSLLLICLFHSLYNTVNGIFSSVYPYIIDEHWYYLGVLFILIIGKFLIRSRKPGNHSPISVINLK